MNGDEDALSAVGQLAKESNDVERRLSIQARRWLVPTIKSVSEGGRGGEEEYLQEKQQFGFRSELDTDRDTLPRFDTETESWESNDAVRVVLELEECEDVLDVGVLLGFRHTRRLSKVRAEAECLSDGRGRFVRVLLLGVSCRSLEVGTEFRSTDEKISGNDADVLSTGEHIEKRRLPCSRRSHKGSESSRSDVAEDVVEKLSSSSADRNGVAVKSRQYAWSTIEKGKD